MIGVMSTTAAVYLVATLVCAYGLWRARRPVVVRGERPRISVVVAARNEERDLPRCLASLEALDYPRDRLELILVDDRSTDGTAAIIAAAAARLPHVRALGTAGIDTHLERKARALAHGASHATGDWIFIADADSAVPPRWIDAMLAYAAPDVGLLGGPFIAEGPSFTGILERGVGVFIMGVPFGVSGLGGAPIASGPNMAIRRDVYVAQGGLEAVEHDVAEDMALLKLVERAGLKCRGGAEPDTTVRVTPVASLVDLLQMQKRWIQGGLRDAPRFILALVLLLGAWAWVGSLMSLGWWLVDPAEWALGNALRFAGTATISAALAHRAGVELHARWLPLVELYLVLGFLVLIPWCLLVPTVRWRGAGFDEHVT